MKHLLTLLLACLPAWGQMPVSAVVPEDKNDPPPIVKLPPFKPVNVAKFDPSAVKARNHPYHVTLVKAPEAWARNPAAKGKGVKVAVLDTGVQHDHPGFDGKVTGLYDAIRKKEGQATDRHGHGTHCAGIVHAIAPEAEIVGIKVLGDSGSGTTADIAHGIDVAVTVFKVDVISLSLGGPDRDPHQEPAIKRAVAAGVVVICAAGNDGPGDTEGFPGRYPDSISVAACDSQRRLAPFSSHGPNVFTADPGVDVLSLLPGTREGEMSGTSMACPVEAGKCASWIASNGIPKNRERRDLFRSVVIANSPFPTRNNARGYGLYTLDKITGEVSTPTPPVPDKPGEKVYTISLADLQRQGYTAVRIDLGSGATSTQPIPVASRPVLAPQPVPAPVVIGQPTPYYPVPQYQPAPVYYPPVQYGGCPGGVCPVPQYQPAPAPVFGRRIWR